MEWPGTNPFPSRWSVWFYVSCHADSVVKQTTTKCTHWQTWNTTRRVPAGRRCTRGANRCACGGWHRPTVRQTGCTDGSGDLRGFGRKPSWPVWYNPNIGLDGVITTSKPEWGWLVSGLELGTGEEGWGAQIFLCGSFDQTLCSDIVIRRLDQTLWPGGVTRIRRFDQALWSDEVVRRCEQKELSDAVIRRSYQTFWSEAVIRRCDQTLWLDAVIRCDQTLWLDAVIRYCDQTLWLDAVIRRCD